MMTDPFASSFGALGVVPIFVNAGTALAPVILGPLAAVGAVILRPRLLVDLCRRKPWVPVVILVVGVGIYFGVAHLMTPAQAAASARGSADASMAFEKPDWQDLAFKLLTAEREA